MNTSTIEFLLESLEAGAEAVEVRFSEFNMLVELKDGRVISMPMRYYPRLQHGTPEERANWIIEGEGIYWTDLDEDIRTADLLIGLPSSESQDSLRKWLNDRKIRA